MAVRLSWRNFSPLISARVPDGCEPTQASTRTEYRNRTTSVAALATRQIGIDVSVG